MVPEINWLAVALAAVSSMVVGFIWYAKPVFGRRWMRLSGIREEDTQKGAALALIILPAIRESFEEGQLNVVVAAGMVGCWAARRSGRSVLAGVLLGAAFCLKPIPGLFFLYYAWRREQARKRDR